MSAQFKAVLRNHRGAERPEAREGGVLVVPHAFWRLEDGGREARDHADRRRHRPAVPHVLGLAQEGRRRPRVGRRGGVGGAPS